MGKRKITYAPFEPPLPEGKEPGPYTTMPGSLLEYTGEYPPGDRYHDPEFSRVEWREVKAFEETLTLRTIERGRSAARFIWRADDGRTFPMFMIDMVGVVQHARIQGGGTVLRGRWIVQKRGQNYGIRLASVEEIREAGL